VPGGCHAFRHSRDVDKRLQWRLIANHDGDLGNPVGVVACPFQVHYDIEDCSHDLEFTHRGAVRGDKPYALVFYIEPLLVDLGIISHHPVRQYQISLLQRLNSALYRLLHRAAHGHNVVFDLQQTLPKSCFRFHGHCLLV
jgi:hypothetical protein